MAAARSAAASGRKHEKQSTPDRARFALSGPSRPLDLTHNAARRDLADVRLAGRWFAPHYAEPERWRVARGTDLLDRPSADVASIGTVAADDTFAVLELSGGWAWGFRANDGLVGYVDAQALAPFETSQA